MAVHSENFGQPLHQFAGLLIGCRPEYPLDQLSARSDLGLVHKSLALGIRLVRGDIGLRRRPDIELQLPAATAVDFTAGKFQRADLREMRVQPHANRLRLSFVAGLQDRANRRQRRQFFQVNSHHSAGRIDQPGAGNIQRKLHGLGQGQRKRALVNLVVLAGGGVTRRQTNCSGRVAGNGNVITSRQRRGDAHSFAAAHQAVVSGPVGHRQIEPRVVEHERHPGLVLSGKPRGQHRQQSRSQHGRGKETTVKQHNVRPGRVRRLPGWPRVIRRVVARESMGHQECREIARHRRVGGIGQAKILKTRLSPAPACP